MDSLLFSCLVPKWTCCSFLSEIHFVEKIKQKYLSCLKDSNSQHNKCRDLSKEYLKCRMDRELMANENLDQLGFSKDAQVKHPVEYDKSKEKDGYVAGKHLDKPLKWWWQS